jgi:alcohol dehydrogenase class IV
MLCHGLQRVKQNPNDTQARLDCQLGVWLSATGIMRVDMGASHGIGHQLGAVAGVPHGHTSCVLLPAVLDYNVTENADRQALISRALGAPERAASELIAQTIAALGMPRTLRDVGVKQSDFEAIANGALQNMFVRANPRPIKTKSDVFQILERCW